jgi:pantoate kinase
MSPRAVRAHVKVPAALSSIFSPKLLDGDELRRDPEHIGACGGGFSITPGVDTWVSHEPDGDGIHVNVNDIITEFPPSSVAAQHIMRSLGLSGEIYIRHRIHVPIATGFGTSAAAALGVILALSHLAGSPMTLSQAVRLVHYVELECRTGLNSEAGFGHNGLVLVRREGAPSYSIVDEIPIPSESRIVSIVAGPIKTSTTLADIQSLKHVEKIGDKYIQHILEEPTAESFLSNAQRFAIETGFADKTVLEIFEAMKYMPVIGYAQNMLGRAVHALAYEEDVTYIVDSLRMRFPSYEIIVSDPGASVSLQLL